MALTVLPHPSRVIAATDGSELSRTALAGGRLIADQLGVELRVVHAIAGKEAIHNALLDEAREQADALGAAFDVIESNEYLIWDVTGPLVSYFAQWPGALPVLTSHGRSGLAKTILGSVAAGLVDQLPAPVLVFGPRAAPPSRYARVLACTDGSGFARGAVGAAAGIARDLSVPLWIVDVVDPDVGDTPAVAALAHELAPGGIHAEWDTLHGRDAARAIVDYADREPGTISVLATHGRTGWRKIVMGSVAADVIRHANGPVLLVGTPTGDRPHTARNEVQNPAEANQR